MPKKGYNQTEEHKKNVSIATKLAMSKLSLEKYPEEFNRFLREKIRERDTWKCQLCGVPEIECNKKLAVHHIDYDKKNLNINNLISLCISCHNKIHLQRDFWKQKFTEIVSEKTRKI